MTIIQVFVFLYMYKVVVCVFKISKCDKGVLMFSPEFMRFLINYQKSDFTPEKTKKEIPLNLNKRGKLAWVNVLVTK